MNADSRPLIAHVVYRLDYGGLENGLVNLLNNLPASRFRHVVVCLSGYGSFRHRIHRPDIDVVSIDKRPGKDFAAYLRLWRLLRRLHPAVVHTRNLGTVDMQWVALAARVPARLHSEHGWEAGDPAGTNPRNLWIRRVCRLVIQRYLAVSSDLASWLQTQVRVPPARITTITNGVDATRFTPAGALPDDLPWRDQAREGLLVIGTVGRLDPVKNQASLLRAFAALRQERGLGPQELQLMLVGAGDLESELRQLAEQLGVSQQVWFTGARDDIPALLRAIDVFVLPSLNEGMSNTLLEAMSSGLPVVAARVGGNPELVEPGLNGQLYAPGTDHALTEALRRYYDAPALRAAHGAAARAKILRQYGLGTMAARYADLYLELISRSNDSCAA